MAVQPEGRRLLRIEARNTEVPIERKPEWIKTRLRTGPQYLELVGLVRDEGLHTVCQEAGCPNIYECWEDREATFLIGGDQCTRRCDFCQIDTGRPQPLDTDEPRRVAESVRTMGLRYATVTGVARDDLADQGAWLYAETIRQIHQLNPDCGVEILIPDFSGEPDLLREVFAASPEVLAHNLETVPRIFKRIRPAFRYERSLGVISAARDAGLTVSATTTVDVDALLHDDPDVLVELIGGTTVARTLVERALGRGIRVVTANKALLATRGNEIFAAARGQGVMVAFEAAVAGGIPIIKALREGLTANRIEWIAGIINGTSNFILSEMRAKGSSFEDVLKEAQRLGYAEADPTFDIEGIDAAHKLSIIAAISFGIPMQFSHAYTEGITKLTAADIKYAEELGYRIKLL
ncbi:MAG TPA: hypothetical protein DHW34_04470, partial [Actinobacteria bacterium]|nr:hypothetical protein [Actinomycetota bacterium]